MMEGGFKVYHSITFGDKNTWDDWHLAPATRPVFAPPALKTKIIDIPGGDGAIDLTEALTKYPVYNNRTGSFEFIVVNDFYEPVKTHEEWYEVYSNIMDYLHGKTMRVILEDDKDYFYEGRFTVSEWVSDKDFSKINIDYNVGPYKWEVKSTIDDWLWDPFNFTKDMTTITLYRNLSVDTTNKLFTFKREHFSRAPVSPTFHINVQNGTGIHANFINESLGINIQRDILNGSHKVPDFIFYGEKDVKLYIRCLKNNPSTPDANVKGTLSIEFRKGRL